MLVTMQFLKIIIHAVHNSSISEVGRKVKESKEYLSKLRLVLERCCHIRLSTVNDCLSVLQRVTTPCNTDVLEKVLIELSCTEIKRNIDESKKSFMDALCCNSSRGFSHFTTVDTLYIHMDYPEETPNATLENFLSSIFGHLFGNVVRWHDTTDGCIVCYFNPIFATLLISKLLENIAKCKEKQVKMITVGFCKVFDKNEV